MNKVAIVKELKELLQKHFPDDINKVILFGSQVNGDAREYSDYDVLIIVNNDYDWRYKKKIFHVTFDIELKYGILTDLKIISKKDLNTIKGKEPFILEALENGIIV